MIDRPPEQRSPLVIVIEISIEMTMHQDPVRLCLVSDGPACQPGQQLIDIFNTLNRTQRVTVLMEIRQKSAQKAMDLPSLVIFW